MIKFFTFLLLFPLSAFAFEIHPSIGTSTFYNNINDPNFDYVDHWNPVNNISSINTGLSLNHNNFVIGVMTNRALNKTIDRKVKSKISGREYINKTKVIADSLYVGYQIKRFQPALFLTNSKVEKSLYQNNTLLTRTKQSSILYGASLGYFFTRNIEGLLIYIAPNKEQYLESGFGVGINFVF